MPDAPSAAAPPPRVSRPPARAAPGGPARQAVHPLPLAPPRVSSGGPAPAATEQGVYASVLAWTETALRDQGHTRPTCKRLALLVAGLVSGDRGTPSGVAHTAFTLRIGTAQQEPSLARRVARL